MRTLEQLRELLEAELQPLFAFRPSDRLWQMPIAAALATGLPLLVGAWFERMDYGLVSTLGGLVFLYLDDSPLDRRMVALMACAFAIVASYTLGALSQLFAPAIVPALTVVAILVTMGCRYYGVGPPGSLFFVMVAAIGAYTPRPVEQLPTAVGLIALGALLACIIAFVYSVHTLRLRPSSPVTPTAPPTFDHVISDSVVIGGCVGISLALAQLFQLERPYWVPVSCLAVIHGTSLRAVWNRQLQRIVGTGIGLLVTWAIFLLPLTPWTMSLTMMVLTLVIETMVVRHYTFAAVFITPLTILLAEAATLGTGSPTPIMQARFVDTLLGCAVGLAGGACLHNAAFRESVGRALRRLVPLRLRD